MPRSAVIASYVVRPGDLWSVLLSPPSRCVTTSVVRLSFADLAETEHDAAVPHHLEFEVLVRIERDAR